MMIIKVFTTYLDHNLIVKMIKMIKKQQNNNIDTKPLNVFDYLKSFKSRGRLFDEEFIMVKLH